MSGQTSVIAAAIVIGLIAYITLRGDLPKYAAVFTGQP